MTTETQSDIRPGIAVLGAGGFVGSRLVESISLDGRYRAMPVLRSFRGLARMGAATQSASVVNTSTLETLTKAFSGAQSVVNLTMGDQLRVLQDTQLVYAACLKARVRQLIHMSSAVVFGRVTDPSTHDDSPPDTHSWMLYARGKAKAEVWLRNQMDKRELQVVVLRPGLIWGPRSNWSEMVGDQLVHGKAILSNHGNGIANLVFIDNLVRIILEVASRPQGPSGFYNIGDNETVSWRDYYMGIAARLGYSLNSVRLWPDNRFRVRSKHAVEWCLDQPILLRLAKCLLKRIGAGTKALIKTRLKGSPAPPRGGVAAAEPPVLSRAHWVLQNTLHRLPTTKLHRDFGPVPLISLSESLDTTAAWLTFAGYGVPATVLVSSNSLPKK